MNNFKFSMENPIGSLKEYSDKNNLPQPTYELRGSTGPDHFKKFNICCVFNEFVAEGSSKTIKDARKQAALNVIALINAKHLSLNNKDTNDSSTNSAAVPEKNYIGIMNEICAKSRYNQPIYNDEKENANNLSQRFTISCYISELNIKEYGTAATKKLAKHIAAQKTYEKYHEVIAEERKTLRAPSALTCDSCDYQDLLKSALPSANKIPKILIKNEITSPEHNDVSPKRNIEVIHYPNFGQLLEISAKLKTIIQAEESNGMNLYSEDTSHSEKSDIDNDVMSSKIERLFDTLPRLFASDKSEMKKYLKFSELHNSFRVDNSETSLDKLKALSFEPQHMNENQVNEVFKIFENALKFKKRLTIEEELDEDDQNHESPAFTAKLRLELNFGPRQLQFVDKADTAEGAERLVKKQAIDFFKIMIHD